MFVVSELQYTCNAVTTTFSTPVLCPFLTSDQVMEKMKEIPAKAYHCTKHNKRRTALVSIFVMMIKHPGKKKKGRKVLFNLEFYYSPSLREVKARTQVASHIASTDRSRKKQREEVLAYLFT